MNIKLTVFFEEPFWVGVFEKLEGTMLETSKTVFGAEPKDYEVYDFINQNYYGLRFSSPVHVDLNPEVKVNPKRLQRVIKGETENRGVGTKAQQAIKLEYEACKVERKKLSKIQREEMKQQKFERRQEKKKEKKKGH